VFHQFLLSLYQRWHIRSLSAKLLLPIVGLMLVSLLGSALTFVGGTALTQSQLLEQQTDVEAQRVVQALETRVENVVTAPKLLAHDPNITLAVQSDGEDDLRLLNARSVLVRDRFGLDLIQIYNRQGQARTNLMLSSLYHESLLLDQVKEDGLVVREVDDRLLLLSRIAMPNGEGTVIAGIDLESELHRIASQYRLPSELGLSFEGVHIGTRDELPFDASEEPALSANRGSSSKGRNQDQYSRRFLVTLGETPVELLLVRPTTEVVRITTAGLVVMIGSTFFTTALLIALSVIVARSIARPIQRLSAAAESVAKGDMRQQVDITNLPNPIGIGTEDEIDLLATTFNGMVAELGDLYENLEAKVKARTHELTTAARVAEAVSSSLNLDEVLRESARLIQERLGFYHVGIFLVQPETDVLVLHEVLCEAGQLLKPRDFQLPLASQSPVGVAATRGKPHIVQDVMAERTYLEMPMLLDTNSEAAIPLLIGNRVIGVLDVQSRQRNVFTLDVIQLLSTLADQIAMGVHNAQLYAHQRRMTEHLTEVDELKTQFLAVMSHELRTPLNSIIGFSKVLLNGLDGPLTENQAQDIAAIHKSGQHLLSLVQDILDITSINAGRVELTFGEVDLGELVPNMLEAVSVLVEEKPVSLRADVAPELPTIYADERRVRQILLNLLSNAAKFTDAGQITVRASVVEALNPRAERVEPFVQVSVSDTGVGIPQNKIADIFKEFTQVDSSDSRRFEGMGLGLPITKRLIELHGGRIWVSTTVNQGSTFMFTLPVHQPEPEQALLLEAKEVSYA